MLTLNVLLTIPRLFPQCCSCLPVPLDDGREQIDAMLTLANILTAGASMVSKTSGLINLTKTTKNTKD